MSAVHGAEAGGRGGVAGHGRGCRGWVAGEGPGEGERSLSLSALWRKEKGDGK